MSRLEIPLDEAQDLFENEPNYQPALSKLIASSCADLDARDHARNFENLKEPKNV